MAREIWGAIEYLQWFRTERAPKVKARKFPMLSEDELLSLYRDIESDRAERKASITSKDRIWQAICAFANDLPNHRKPGVIFVGQYDDGTCANLGVDDQLLLTLSSVRDGRFVPFPDVTVEKRTFDNCTIACIQVEPSSNPPVKFDGRVWIRVGPRRGQATPEEERRLVEKRRWGQLPFDAHGVKGASITDLDLDRFVREILPSMTSPEALAANNRTREEQLQGLRFLQPDGTPTTTALLIMGKEPRTFFPGAYIQFLRIDGANLTDQIIDAHEIGGALPDQLRRVDELLSLNNRQAVAVGAKRRVDTPDYPIEALRQYVRNALIHRTYEASNAPVRITWYSDRIEVQNPGGVFGQVTKENFGMPGAADYRNPTVAAALKALGYVERFGIGLAIARDALARNGNPAPQFTIDDTNVLVTVKLRP